MKFTKKINVDEIDDMLIDDIIKYCEDAMSSPYKEKAKAKMVLEAEPENEMEEELHSSHEDESDDLDDDKKEKLRKMYAMLGD